MQYDRLVKIGREYRQSCRNDENGAVFFRCALYVAGGWLSGTADVETNKRLLVCSSQSTIYGGSLKMPRTQHDVPTLPSAVRHQSFVHTGELKTWNL